MSILDLVLPPACAGCGQKMLAQGLPFCELCLVSVILLPPCCSRCGAALEVDGICRPCRDRPPLVAGVHAILLHGGQAARAIWRLKYEGASHLAHSLGRLMQPEIQTLLDRIDVVVPVPLHRRRLIQRGYNQAALLARAALHGTQIPVRYDLLTRPRATPAQTGLGRAGRWANVQGAFSARSVKARVLLIDDVATTNSTATACTAALLSAGAHEVRLLTLARAMR